MTGPALGITIGAAFVAGTHVGAWLMARHVRKHARMVQEHLRELAERLNRENLNLRNQLQALRHSL